MSCADPFFLFDKEKHVYKTDAFGNTIQFPCGVCENCKRDKIAVLEQRAKYEWRNHEYCAFIDLTYDVNHLKYNYHSDYKHILPTLSKKDFHKYIDNLRHYLKNHNIKNCDPKFSFIGCGEYGDDNFRPHMHIILFGVDFSAGYKLLNKLWPNGYVDVKPLENGGIRYVIEYLEKQKISDTNDQIYFDRGINQPFVSWSKGFGSGFYRDNADSISKTGCVKIGNSLIPVPSYYKYKYMQFNWDNIENIEFNKRRIKLQKKEIAKQYGFKDINTFDRYMTLSKELNIIQSKSDRRKEIDCLHYAYVLRDLQNIKKRRFLLCPH